MEKLIIITLFTFCFNMATAQRKTTDTCELKDIIFNKEHLQKLIGNNSRPYKLKIEPFSEHPFYYDNVNRVMDSSAGKYTLLGLPVENFYAYVVDKDKFAVYQTVGLDIPTIEKLILQLGKPENMVDEDPIPLAEYDMFFWPLKDFNVMLSRPSFGSLRNRFSITVYTNNMHFRELRRKLK